MRAARTKPDGRLRTSLAALSRLGDLPAVALLAWAGWLAMPWSFSALAQAHTATETTGGQGAHETSATAGGTGATEAPRVAAPPSTHETARVTASPSPHETALVAARPSTSATARVTSLPSTHEIARVHAVPATHEIGRAANLPATHEIGRAANLPATHEIGRAASLPATHEIGRAAALPVTHEIGRAVALPVGAFPVAQHPSVGSVGGGTAEPGGTAAVLSAERAKLAAEVHDAAGHGFAAIAMQANIALRLLEQNPDQARASLEAIRDTSTDALTRLRGALDAMDPAPGSRVPDALAAHAEPGARAVPAAHAVPGVHAVPAAQAVLGAHAAPGDAIPGGPVPGTDLARLIAGVRAAGLVVAVAPDDPVPAHLATPVYGVVRESLTNVLRHAGTAGVSVKLAATLGEFVVEVADQGWALVPAPEGRGLAGMRAQVAAAGGVFTAGPRQGGGFQVIARFPAKPAPTPTPATAETNTGKPAPIASPTIST
ncbi:histidine kinase [Nonomuraea sp. NPDC050663]|uniref:histidine kinase n=1 Tax=Nonomuraea sp. NPDC050663 TaxID=3364370 RepID=UPI00379366E6